jgi:hypothetical protein
MKDDAKRNLINADKRMRYKQLSAEAIQLRRPDMDVSQNARMSDHWCN